MEQMTGIGPAYQPWQGRVLPLNYICRASIIIKKGNLLIKHKINKI